MGRFYNGDIEGKFWFGIQDSYDINNLINVNHINSYIWKSCSCYVENVGEEYCHDCYESKEEHINNAIEDGEYVEDSDNDEYCKKLYYEENVIEYNLEKDKHYQELIDNMAVIRKDINKDIIAEFDKITQDDNILDAFTGVFDNTLNTLNSINNIENNREQLLLVARYTLGIQIEYCLKKNGTCNVNCEC